MDYSYTGKQIRHYRRQRGMSQSELAAALGLSAAHVGHLERGSRRASLETMVAISRQLAVSLDLLIFPELGQEGVPEKCTTQLLCEKLAEASTLAAALLTEHADG